MKFIYIANARIPTEKAHGLQIMKMCEAFARAGAEVELIAPWRFNKIKENPFDYYGVERIFKITKLPSLDFIPLSSFLGSFAFWIQAITFLISARLYLLFSALGGKQRNILYTREPLAGLFFKNCILEIHLIPQSGLTVHKKIWQKAKALIVLTSFIKQKLAELDVPKNKILVASDAVDLKEFGVTISKEEARQKLNLSQDKKIILYFGSFYLYDWKGVDVLLDAAKYFDDKSLFVLVGGTDEEILEIKEKFNPKNILLIGHQSHLLMPIFLKAADVLVLPNKKGDETSEKHTSPLKLFEYMAAERPIIASNLPSIREILNDPSTGSGQGNAILVEPNNPEALAEGIKKLLQNPELAGKISEQAFKDVQEYTWAKRAEKILEFIKNKNARNQIFSYVKNV